jgi:hypothetical protein
MAWVGRDTYLKARQLGFLEPKTTPGKPGSEIVGPLLGPFAAQLRQEAPPPSIARDDTVPQPPPPAGNTREQSFGRLRAEAWQSSTEMKNALTQGQGVFQLLKNGAGDYIYDEYSVVVDAMPAGKTPESFLEDMASDLNGTVKDCPFDTINVFRRRGGGKPRLGELIDIDILGPENGCREFGFERTNSGIRFYTRGVSRPGNFLIRLAGSVPQQQGWTRLMLGISARIVQLGGKSNGGSFQMFKESKP